MTNAISSLSISKQIGLAMGISAIGYFGEKVNSKALMIISGLGLLALGFAYAVNYCSKPSQPEPPEYKKDEVKPTIPVASPSDAHVLPVSPPLPSLQNARQDLTFITKEERAFDGQMSPRFASSSPSPSSYRASGSLTTSPSRPLQTRISLPSTPMLMSPLSPSTSSSSSISNFPPLHSDTLSLTGIGSSGMLTSTSSLSSFSLPTSSIAPQPQSSHEWFEFPPLRNWPWCRFPATNPTFPSAKLFNSSCVHWAKFFT